MFLPGDGAKLQPYEINYVPQHSFLRNFIIYIT
jgi:hypothetical protein